jgi:hypothetical protein
MEAAMRTTQRYLIALLFPALALAQNWNASLHFGPGALISRYGDGSAMYGGFAIERMVAGRFAIGIDIGVAETGKTNFNYSGGLLSFGGSYHFLPGATRKADPFVAIGVSAITQEGAPALFHLGVGMNYWIKKNFGLKAEIRDHATSDNGTALHYLASRFGVAFRW